MKAPPPHPISHPECTNRSLNQRMGFSTIDYKITSVLTRPISTVTLIHNDHSVSSTNENNHTNPLSSSNNDSSDDADSNSTEEKCVARGGVVTPFPWKLHDMLERVDIDGFEHIVSWQPHGRSFMVHKPDEFVEQVMPVYFNQTKFASFQRQLNLYGFRRITQGRDKGAYYHECFQRGRRNLCQGMHRQKVKGTRVRRAIAPGMEPDFWNLPFLPDKKKTTTTTKTSKTTTTQNSKTNQDDGDSGTCTEGPDAPPSSSIKIKLPSKVCSSCSSCECPLTPTLSDDLLIREWTGEAMASAVLSNDVLFFEGKPFHYLDKQMVAEYERRVRIDSVEIDPMIHFVED